jgi:PAS domain S-box-containing protein
MNDQSIMEETLAAENRDLRARLEAAEETLRAIHADEIDALVVKRGDLELVRTLEGADQAYRAFVEVMCQGAATVSADGSILYCNEHFSKLLGSPSELCVGETVYEYVAPDDEGQLRALLWEGLAASCISKSIRLRRHDGTAISVVITATPLNIDRVPGLCLVLTDLTDREARVAAEAANSAKDRFLAAVSHELRTPLSPVVMAVAALTMDTRLPADVHEDLAMIRRNVELETRLIDDLLDLSRAVTGKLRLQLEPVGVRALIEHVLQMVQSELQEKSLKVECAWLARQDCVMGDSARLQQVIWNVIKNAAKFSNKFGTIRVRLSNPDEQMLQFEVQDHGIGIDPVLLPRIFNAFEQGEAPAAAQLGGLGLGLSISKAVVEMHHGTVTAFSQGAGKGATITMRIPLTSLKVADVPKTAGNGSPSEDVGVRVLLVEDHQETGTVLARLLRKYGHHVKIADTMARALEFASSEPFDLIISDIGLPDGTGHDLMKQIKERFSIPGVALTGYGMEDDITRSHEVGFVEHVVKPVDIAQLQSVIRRVCGPK